MAMTLAAGPGSDADKQRQIGLLLGGPAAAAAPGIASKHPGKRGRRAPLTRRTRLGAASSRRASPHEQRSEVVRPPPCGRMQPPIFLRAE